MICGLRFWQTMRQLSPKHRESVKRQQQKLILELKDKLDLEDAFEQKLANQAAADTTKTAGDSQLQEAVQALVALGYPNTDALRAVKKVEGAETMDVETLLKAALKKML